MKTERRHELKTNDLARNAEDFPDFLRRYGNRILFVVLAVMLVIILILHRRNATIERTQRSAQNLAVARTEIIQLSQMPITAGDQRDFYYHDIIGRLDQVAPDLEDSPAMAAQALLDRGDADWTFSNVLAASTQPSTVAESSPQELLNSAADAYSQLISKYGDQPVAVMAAHLGLAAIAENQKDWVKARTQYQAVVDSDAASATFKEFAKRRLDGLDQLAQPVYLAQVPAAATQPTTNPSLTIQSALTPGSATQPFLSLPTTLPVALTPPTTLPVALTPPPLTPATLPSR